MRHELHLARAGFARSRRHRRGRRSRSDRSRACRRRALRGASASASSPATTRSPCSTAWSRTLSPRVIAVGFGVFVVPDAVHARQRSGRLQAGRLDPRHVAGCVRSVPRSSRRWPLSASATPAVRTFPHGGPDESRSLLPVSTFRRSRISSSSSRSSRSSSAASTMHVTFITIVMFALTAILATVFVAGFAPCDRHPGQAAERGRGRRRRGTREHRHPILGADGERFMPYLTSIFFFVFAMNFMEVVPVVQFPLTSRMALPVLFSLDRLRDLQLPRDPRSRASSATSRRSCSRPGVPKGIYVHPDADRVHVDVHLPAAHAGRPALREHDGRPRDAHDLLPRERVLPLRRGQSLPADHQSRSPSCFR